MYNIEYQEKVHIMNYKKFLVIDFELTCWDNNDNTNISEIIEIGIVELDSNNMEILRTGQYFVKPNFSEISKYCSQLTGITDKKLKHAFLYDKIAEILKNKWGTKNKTWMAWGIDLKSAIDNDNLYNIENTFSYSYVNLSHIFSIKHKNKKATNLKEALKYYNLEFEGREHSALSDAINTAKLAKLLL